MARADGFWNFSLEVYARPGVPEACLLLQERLGLDVNLLLFCCWFGSTRGRLDEPMLNAVLSFSGAWAEQVVRPLRGARQWMKSEGCARQELDTDDCLALRKKIKALELEAERLQQESLEGLASGVTARSAQPAARIDHAAANLARYAGRAEADFDETALSMLGRIVSAAVTDAGGNDVTAGLRQAFSS